MLAVGKAAPGMADALSKSLSEMGADLLPALTIGTVVEGKTMAGDHPIPGDASAGAALAIDRWVRELDPSADVHIALSGGASALMAAPLPGLSDADLRSTFRLLLGSGLEIEEMNAVRKRISRWSAGRLARALAPRRTFVWIISDVPDDEPATIASGPCHGDPWGVDTVRRLLEEHDIWSKLSPAVQAAMGVETLKPGAAGLGEVRSKIVARNSDALRAAADHATRRGVKARIVDRPLSGEAADAGRTIARKLVKTQIHDWPPGILADPVPQPPELWLYGGETVVTLGDSSHDGGRNQELALAAAEVFAEQLSASSIMLLAAGTDGRDGSTSAAGALVDGTTWGRIATSGHNPAEDLAQHNSHAALAAAGALLQTGQTGTNVMDIVLGFSDRWEQFDKTAAQ